MLPALVLLFAQERTGFAIDRFEPAERGSSFFVVDALDFKGRARPAFGTTFAYSQKPLVVLDTNGDERFALVRHQAFFHSGGSFIWRDRLRLGLNVPFAIDQDGEDGVVNGEAFRGATKPALADIRVAADARLVGPFAAGVRVWLPTGSRSQFTSDGPIRIAPQVLATGSLLFLTWAARVAFVYRPRDDEYAGAPRGSELFGAIGGGLRAGKVTVGPELQASTLVSDAFGKKSTPVELLGGIHWEIFSGVRLALGSGIGLGEGFGAARFRALFGIEWVEPLPPPPIAEEKKEDIEPIPPEDADGDGVFDTDDACPTIAGVRTQDPMTNGCPANTPRPLAVVTKDQIRIGEEIRFATDSAELLGDSDAVLGAVKKVLDEHPDIKKVRIEGHTDSVGDAAYNDELSARRAASVTQWLAGHGIDERRLESRGFGSRRPIDSNDTEAGRARNRRVVFTIVERDGR